MIRENSRETILCVCYTNHALDQFLEHMFDNGEREIVRIGGRSKSEKLKPFNLRELSRNKSDLGYDDRRRLKQVDFKWHKQRESIEVLMKTNDAPLKWDSPYGGAKAYIDEHDHDFYEQLSMPHDIGENFVKVGKKGKKAKSDYLWELWKKGGDCPGWLTYPPYNRDHMESFHKVWDMEPKERMETIHDWRNRLLGDIRADLFDQVAQFNKLSEERQLILRQKDLKILQDAKVIGATTTGAAQYRDILDEIKAGVVIAEEAGEVFEAHVLTALSNQTKHLILIGDHKQLRPKAETYDLTTVSGKGYNLDCSLFERLVCSNLPSAMLQVQHRMRPSISDMVRKQTYPGLKDHPDVTKYPAVRGVKGDVIFIDHDVKEDGLNRDESECDSHNKTKSNIHEAKLCVELVRYFLLQGYSMDQIVVLTPYVGQLLKIVNTMRKELSETAAYLSELDIREFDEEVLTDTLDINLLDGHSEKKSVRCASIDNFQGEESDIIIASLVRSNRSGNIGFLKEEQRVNVLLSRARHGLYIVGNSTTLLASKKGKHVWTPLLGMMQIERGLPTYCQLHPNDEVIDLSEPGAFRKFRPNGGCSRACNYRMSCGHMCSQSCHPIDRDHKATETLCSEPCRRVPPECNLSHICTKLCKDNCGPCTSLVDGPFQLPCGHVKAKSRCHDVRNEEALEKLSKKCTETVKMSFKDCDHKEFIECRNARSDDPKCPAKCGKKQDCGHNCTNRLVFYILLLFTLYLVSYFFLHCEFVDVVHVLMAIDARKFVSEIFSAVTVVVIFVIFQTSVVPVRKSVR